MTNSTRAYCILKNMDITTERPMNRTPLNSTQTQYVVKCLTLGNTHKEIQKKFDLRYERKLNLITIGRIKKRHLETIGAGKTAIVHDGTVKAATLKQKSYQLIEAKLDAALEDNTELQKLRKEFQSGTLSESTYKQKRALYEELTINELSKISESLHNQGKDDKADPTTPQDQAAMAALLEAVKLGNPINLIQMLNPTINAGGMN